jgi:hypothetical protein
VFNLTAGAFDVSRYRPWLLGAATVVAAASIAGAAITRARTHEITTTAGGAQIVVDNGPRAVLGIQTGERNQQTLIGQQMVLAPRPVPAFVTVQAPSGLHNLPPATTVFVGRNLHQVEQALAVGGPRLGRPQSTVSAG